MGSAQSARGTQPGGSRYGGSVSLGIALTGDPRPSRLRPPSGAFPPRRCAATGSGSAWKGLGAKVAGGFGLWLYSAPPPPTSPLPGAADAVPRCAFLPPSGPRPSPPLTGGCGGRVPGGFRQGTGPPRPRRDCRPGRTVLSASQPRRDVSRAGTGSRTPGARGRRRCRLPTRPVLKHGPRSLTHARVRGSLRNPAAQ